MILRTHIFITECIHKKTYTLGLYLIKSSHAFYNLMLDNFVFEIFSTILFFCPKLTPHLKIIVSIVSCHKRRQAVHDFIVNRFL